MVTPETRVYPQNILLAVGSASLIPSFIGMPWWDNSVSVMKFDSTGAGDPTQFVTALPQHTLTGEHGPKVTITQTSGDNALVVNQVGNAVALLLVSGSGAGRVIDITQAANHSAIAIAKTGTGGQSALSVSNSGSDFGVSITQIGLGSALGIIQNSNNIATSINKVAAGIGAGLSVINAGTDEGIVVTQNGPGFGVRIFQNGESQALRLEKASTGVSPALMVFNTGIGQGLYVEQRGEGTGIYVNKSLGGASAVVRVDNVGTGPAFDINQNADGIILDIDRVAVSNSSVIDIAINGGIGLNVLQTNATSNNPVILVTNNGAGSGITVNQSGPGTALVVNGTAAGQTLTNITRNASGTGYALQVTQSHTGSGNSALIINNSGSLHGLHVQNLFASGANAAIRIDNTGTGKDIEGNAASWSVDKSGNAKFTSVTLGTSLVALSVVVNWASSGGNFDAAFSLPLPSGTWLVRVDAVFHSAVLWETILFINGVDIMHLPFIGDTDGTDYLKLMGVRSVSGGGSIPIIVRSITGLPAPNPVFFTIMAWKTA